VAAWPATITRPAPGGWLLRATPGLDRARSNNALTPCRELRSCELAAAIERVQAFAGRHSIRPGVQVSPVALHGPLQAELDARGWQAQWPTLVLTGPVGHRERPPARRAGASLELVTGDHAGDDWLRAWARCEPGRDVGAHARTVFALLHGQAEFVRAGHRAVAIGVEADGLLGLFCVAVAPAARGRGVGTALMEAMLARTRARLAYLQVEEGNVAAREMYGRLGFTEAYRYCHRLAAR
jgi:ribosomal protein S18 acetylase RimI-like enzyme